MEHHYSNEVSRISFIIRNDLRFYRRIRLKCRCQKVDKGQRCSRILPFDDQQWSGYMGSHADSHWTNRKQS